jgi:hypothetical protein
VDQRIATAARLEQQDRVVDLAQPVRDTQPAEPAYDDVVGVGLCHFVGHPLPAWHSRMGACPGTKGSNEGLEGENRRCYRTVSGIGGYADVAQAGMKVALIVSGYALGDLPADQSRARRCRFCRCVDALSLAAQEIEQGSNIHVW